MNKLPFYYPGDSQFLVNAEKILEWFRSGHKISLIRALRYYRNPAQNDTLKDCKDAIENCQEEQEILDLFGCRRSQEDAEFQDFMTHCYPTILKDYMAFGYKSAKEALTDVLNRNK